MSQRRSDSTLELALAAGVNHYDTAASYGESELRMAPFLSDQRKNIFLATKTGERKGPAARAELELSLTRLGVEGVDLIQLHNLVQPGEWETAFSAGGALEALVQARDEGLVRFIGVTGHGLEVASMHLRSLAEFPFDSVLFPYNVTMMDDPAYAADVDSLRRLCIARRVAVQTIKSISVGRWPEGYGGPQYSWYEPLAEREAIGRAVGYVLSNEQLFLNTTSDATKLPDLFAFADDYVAPDPTELRGDIERFSMTPLFDAANPA